MKEVKKKKIKKAKNQNNKVQGGNLLSADDITSPKAMDLNTKFAEEAEPINVDMD
jgi:hypothetical protein